MKKYITLALLVSSFCNQTYSTHPALTIATFMKNATDRSVDLIQNNQVVRASTVLSIHRDQGGNVTSITFNHPHRREVSPEVGNQAHAQLLTEDSSSARLYALMMGERALPSGTIVQVDGKTWTVGRAPVGSGQRLLIAQ